MCRRCTAPSMIGWPRTDPVRIVIGSCRGAECRWRPVSTVRRSGPRFRRPDGPAQRDRRHDPRDRRRWRARGWRAKPPTHAPVHRQPPARRPPRLEALAPVRGPRRPRASAPTGLDADGPRRRRTAPPTGSGAGPADGRPPLSAAGRPRADPRAAHSAPRRCRPAPAVGLPRRPNGRPDPDENALARSWAPHRAGTERLPRTSRHNPFGSCVTANRRALWWRFGRAALI